MQGTSWKIKTTKCDLYRIVIFIFFIYIYIYIYIFILLITPPEGFFLGNMQGLQDVFSIDHF